MGQKYYVEQLGDGSRQLLLTCDTTGRTSLEVNWLKDGVLLTIDGNKYLLNSAKNRLTIRDIMGADEGNYTCSYTAGSIQTNAAAGCVLVYGNLYISNMFVAE